MEKPDFHAEFIEACMLASGYAHMCGYHAAARTLAQYATCDKKALTGAGKGDTIKTTARTGGKQEESTMKKIKVWAFTANGIGWNRPQTMYFDSREHAEAAYAHYTYKDPIYYAGTFSADKFIPAHPLSPTEFVHDGQLEPTNK